MKVKKAMKRISKHNMYFNFVLTLHQIGAITLTEKQTILERLSKIYS